MKCLCLLLGAGVSRCEKTNRLRLDVRQFRLNIFSCDLANPAALPIRLACALEVNDSSGYFDKTLGFTAYTLAAVK